jgi:DNA repair protein RadD
MEQGYLSPVISKGGMRQIDLDQVLSNAGREFVEHRIWLVAASDPELGERLLSRRSCALVLISKSWLVFSQWNKPRLDMLKDEFEAHDIDVGVITGSDGSAAREKAITDFKSGKLRCLINVNVLTTGFDHASLLIWLHWLGQPPATGLYVQMVGPWDAIVGRQGELP